MAFDDEAFYRVPSERVDAAALGIRSLGRRPQPDSGVLPLQIDGRSFAVPTASWVEHYDAAGAEIVGRHDGRPAAIERRLGDGTVVSIGTFPGLAHERSPSTALHDLAGRLLARAGVEQPIRVHGTDGTTLQWRRGTSGGWTVLFLTGSPSDALVVDGSGLGAIVELEELTGARAALDGDRLLVTLSEWGVAVVRWR
jgi:beta-galactosidase